MPFMSRWPLGSMPNSARAGTLSPSSRNERTTNALPISNHLLKTPGLGIRESGNITPFPRPDKIRLGRLRICERDHLGFVTPGGARDRPAGLPRRPNDRCHGLRGISVLSLVQTMRSDFPVFDARACPRCAAKPCGGL